MRISKISAKATYHKCLKALHAQGYIKYEPSYNPFRGSHVIMFNFAVDLKSLLKNEKSANSNFEQVVEQVAGRSQASSETGNEQVDEQVVVPSINNTNITNNKNIENALNLREPPKKNEEVNSGLKNYNRQEKEKSSAKKEMPGLAVAAIEQSSTPAFVAYTAEQAVSIRQKEPSLVTSGAVGKPTVEEVLAYFLEQNFPEIEANKFFNYFKSIGWLVGGKTPMADWTAAANNWILNAPKYTPHERTDRTRDLDTSTGKDYGEPL